MSEAALYGGMDLHGDNVFISLLDTARRTVYERRLPNDMAKIAEALEPYRKRIQALAVESTYNWYWLVDGLSKLNFPAKLANPSKMQENIGLKHANDKTDARFIARQLINGTLPEGYIYPEETRGVRDMLRRRTRLMHIRTGEILSVSSLIARHTGLDVSYRNMDLAEMKRILEEHPHAIIMGEANFRHIEFLDQEIASLEEAVMRELPDHKCFLRLMTAPGIGPVLARVILLETGPIERFKDAGNYASYCRTVKAEHTSNNKKKGACNSKNGNKYLAWAYVEAANQASRCSPEIRGWFQRKLAKSGKRVIAIKALANKMSKACFFMLRDGKDFDVKKLVG
jgi:transposase